MVGFSGVVERAMCSTIEGDCRERSGVFIGLYQNDHLGENLWALQICACYRLSSINNHVIYIEDVVFRIGEENAEYITLRDIQTKFTAIQVRNKFIRGEEGDLLFGRD